MELRQASADQVSCKRVWQDGAGAHRLDDLRHLLGGGVQVQPRVVFQPAVPPVGPEVLTAQLTVLESLQRLPDLQVLHPAGITASRTTRRLTADSQYGSKQHTSL